MKPQYNEPLCNEHLDTTIATLHPSNSKMLEKEP